jgi:hypothetical protein
MVLPVSPNPISAGNIRNEFGPISGSVSFGAYRINQTVGTLSNLPLDTGIPKSGSIKFSNFRGKKLNVVVDFHSIADDTTRRNARSRYDNNGVTVIGGFRSRPSNSSNIRVYINVNKRIGSDRGSRNNVALITGSWNSNTELILVIGSSGGLYGAGGNGGGGGYSNAGNGGQGSSALGIQYPTTVINQGTIFGGVGGGGGGSGGSGDTFRDVQRGCQGVQSQSIVIAGGGGAGGRGLPGGDGGGLPNTQKSSFATDSVTLPTAGTAGSRTQNGRGGLGGRATYWKQCSQTAVSGAGGGAGGAGGGGNFGQAGQPGQRGYSIIIGTGGEYSISGNGPDPSVQNNVGQPS